MAAMQNSGGQLLTLTEETRINHNRFTKIEFPKFEGDNVEDWIYKCEHFYTIDATPETSKIRYVAIHITGRALSWHQGYMKSSGKTMENITWDEYSRSTMARFSTTHMEDAMGALKALVQEGELDEYCDQFDKLLNKVTLCEEYSVSIFVEGLKPEIKCYLKMFKPKTLRDAYSLAKIQDQANKMLGKQQVNNYASSSRNMSTTPRSSSLSNAGKPPILATPVNAIPSIAIVPKKVNNKFFEVKRAKGECFWCNEKFVQGHNKACKGKKQLFLVEVEEELDEELEEINLLNTAVRVQGEPQISLNAIMGIPSYSTMQIVGTIGTRNLHILVDGGSTHNFMSKILAEKVKCILQDIPNVNVTMANGNRMDCVKMCKGFQWIMQGNWYTADMLVIELNNYDIVLGVQWLETLNDIIWNFKHLTMKFHVGDQEFQLKGVAKHGVQLCSMEKMSSLLHDSHSVAQAQLCTLHDATSDHQVHKPTLTEFTSDDELKVLLERYADVFAIPIGLPPPRSCDHKIVLKDEKLNLNLKPYRYPRAQKDVIEQMTQELLDSGVIRHSTSCFVAPVVLVKKKDGSWRMCIDYRKLMRIPLKMCTQFL
uniref:uncharacterized protein LOC122592345 n=1 Tax=Erigeron canadensis TaxID=72917 RepID=UPI001CB94D11|nr:uncharacterized protein LOC122592345 [Erigeron canadensis]